MTGRTGACDAAVGNRRDCRPVIDRSTPMEKNAANSKTHSLSAWKCLPSRSAAPTEKAGRRNVPGGKKTTQSIADGIPTQSVGTRGAAAVRCRYPCYSLGENSISDSRRVKNLLSGSCRANESARSYEFLASDILPERRHNSARAAWER